MADLHEYNFSVIEDKSSSGQKRNLSLRHVLCIPCRCCFAGSLQFSSSTVKPETNPLQFPRCFPLSYQKNFSRKTFSLNVCEATRRCKLQAASAYKKREFWRETHTSLRLLTGRIIFLTREKTPFASPVGRIIFSTCEKHCSLFWLARTHLSMKLHDTAWWIFLSMYV